MKISFLVASTFPWAQGLIHPVRSGPQEKISLSRFSTAPFLSMCDPLSLQGNRNSALHFLQASEPFQESSMPEKHTEMCDFNKNEASARNHQTFDSPEAYHEANQVYLKSQERYPFRFHIINPRHLRANETFIGWCSPYAIFVVQAQHVQTGEIVPHVVSFGEEWAEPVVNQVALPIPALPWVIDSLETVFQPDLNLTKERCSESLNMYEDFFRVRMEIEYEAKGQGQEREIVIRSQRPRSDGSYFTQLRGPELLMVKDFNSMLTKIYLKYASPEAADNFYNEQIRKIREKIEKNLSR
ncbi:MAG: hypothetical protein V4629_12965 [Pseudomonadota bacterium]